MSQGGTNRIHRRSKRILIAVIAVLVFAGILAVLLVPAIFFARKATPKSDCKSHLKQLGVCLRVYVSKFGGGHAYPPTNGVPNFLDYLRNVPNSHDAVAAGSHGQFVCRHTGNMPSPTSLDYRYPAATRTIDDATQPHWPIACDSISNHGGDEINVLLFDGSVVTAQPGDLLWSSCVGDAAPQWMQGP